MSGTDAAIARAIEEMEREVALSLKRQVDVLTVRVQTTSPVAALRDFQQTCHAAVCQAAKTAIDRNLSGLTLGEVGTTAKAAVAPPPPPIETMLPKTELQAPSLAAMFSAAPTDRPPQEDVKKEVGGAATDPAADDSPRETGEEIRTDQLQYDSMALLVNKAPTKMAPLSHLTGLRGVFILMVVLFHFVPRPSENVGSRNFVDQIDVAKGWAVQDMINKIIDRVPGWAMPYLFTASGFGVHLTYRRKGWKLADFYLARLPRPAIIIWLLLAVEFVVDKLLPKRMQPHFQPASIPLWGFFFNAITLGTFRPIAIQTHLLVFFKYPWPLATFEPTTSPDFNRWLEANTRMIPTIMQLWFLTYTVICIVCYPLIAKYVHLLERFFGTFGLVVSIVGFSFLALLPMLIDKSEVHLNFEGAQYFDSLTWAETERTEPAISPIEGHQRFWTDWPQQYDHHIVMDGAVWNSSMGLLKDAAKGKRNFLMHYKHPPQYRLPWFANEPSVFPLMCFLLWYANGVAACACMVRIEKWSQSVEDDRKHSASAREVRRVEREKTRRARQEVVNERTALKGTTTATEDDEGEDEEAGAAHRGGGTFSTEGVPRKPSSRAGPTARLIRRLTSRLHEGSIRVRKLLISHRGRGLLADACVLSILVPCLWQPIDYNKYRDGYFPRANGWKDVSNWSRGYGPIFCLFLYGSSSQGGAGVFASLFSSAPLVALGEISLAVYCFQGTVARFCAVRWFTRGPNLENHCKDLDDYFKEMPGRLTAHMNEAGYHLTQHRASLNLNDAEKRYLDSDSPLCLDTTGDLLCLYIVALLVIASVITYSIEPFLDEEFRELLSLAGGGVRRAWAYTRSSQEHLQQRLTSAHEQKPAEGGAAPSAKSTADVSKAPPKEEEARQTGRVDGAARATQNDMKKGEGVGLLAKSVLAGRVHRADS